jgi:hypothetical protein
MLRIFVGLLKAFAAMLLAQDPTWAHEQWEQCVGQLRLRLTRVGWKVLAWRRK